MSSPAEDANSLLKAIVALVQASKAHLLGRWDRAVATPAPAASDLHAQQCSTAFQTIIVVDSVNFAAEASINAFVSSITGILHRDLFGSSNDALLVDLFSLPPEDRLLALHSLSTFIPPFTTLCLVCSGLESLNDEEATAFVRAIANCTRLFVLDTRSYQLRPCKENTTLMEVMLHYLPSCSLTSLTFHSIYLKPSQVGSIFASLQNNLRLTSLNLTLCYSYYDTWPITTILDSLRSNAIIHQVTLTRTQVEHNADIAAQLQNNAENAARQQLLSSQGMQPVRPSTIRLYLCGLPLSGKTTISRSLAHWSKGSTTSRRYVSQRKEIKITDRTRGIKVTVLESQQGKLQISVWDMAGQLEYHSFHDSMLPDLNDRAIPPLFLYVWNPFKMDQINGIVEQSAQGQRLKEDFDQFKVDCTYWLKFIASKTPKSKLFKPTVIVTITREDFGISETMKEWLDSAFKELQEEFQEYILLDMKGIFYVDARDVKKISSLALHLFECAGIILRGIPDEFRICNEARNYFRDLIRKKEIPPLITRENFFFLTQKNLGIESQDICEAVALSLNSSGDLIYFPSAELVVIDTQWFCEKIMGDLIRFSVENFDSKQGFFKRQSLESSLEEMSLRLVKKWNISWTRGVFRSQKCVKVSGHAIVKLMMNLRLACPRDSGHDDSDVFIPASLCGKASDRFLTRKYLQDVDGSSKPNSYIGRRWAVKDSKCTFLTPGIFPLIQVTFNNILSNQNIHVDLEQDVMAFGFEGARVFVEFCRLEGQENFIDVLVVSRQKLDDALKWLHKNVTSEMTKVFADSRGIPGVELAQFVIQPAAIQELMEARHRKAVPEQVLKDCFMSHVQTNRVKLTEAGIQSMFYTWQPKCVAHDPIVALLGEAEIRKLVDSYKVSLSEAETHLFLDVSASVVGEDEGASRQPEKQRPEFGNTRSEKQREAIYDKLCDVELLAKREFQRLADQIEDLQGAVLPKLCEMFTFVAEGEAGKLPRMYAVTQDDGIVRRVVSKIVPGVQNLRLELLCECRNAPCHPVERDHKGRYIGLSITTLEEDGLLSRGLPYIEAFLKVAHVVTKVGAHVAFGLGDSIPDFTQVLAGIVDANQVFAGPLPLLSESADSPPASSLRPADVHMRQGQQWLYDVLSHHNCIKSDQIYRQFGLRRIRYADSTVVWVCDAHYLGGTPFPA